VQDEYTPPSPKANGEASGGCNTRDVTTPRDIRANRVRTWIIKVVVINQNAGRSFYQDFQVLLWFLFPLSVTFSVITFVRPALAFTKASGFRAREGNLIIHFTAFLQPKTRRISERKRGDPYFYCGSIKKRMRSF
jgi:hypothetical protein